MNDKFYDFLCGVISAWLIVTSVIGHLTVSYLIVLIFNL